MTPRATLLPPVQSLLKALTATPPSPSEILKTFTSTPIPLVHEHGLPQLAPFLGRSFTGQDGVARYFQLLGETVEIREMVFEDEEMWCVDDVAMAVALRGRATFYWKGSGQGWEETFFYRIALAVDVGEQEGDQGGVSAGGGDGRTDLGGVGVGVNSSFPATSPSSLPPSSLSAKKEKDVFGDGKLKVCEYRVWADTGAAYLARLGRLGELVVDGCVDGSGRSGYEGIHIGSGEEERKKERDGSGETRRSLSRKRSGGQDVLGAGLNVYGSSG